MDGYLENLEKLARSPSPPKSIVVNQGVYDKMIALARDTELRFGSAPVDPKDYQELKFKGIPVIVEPEKEELYPELTEFPTKFEKLLETHLDAFIHDGADYREMPLSWVRYGSEEYWAHPELEEQELETWGRSRGSGSAPFDAFATKILPKVADNVFKSNPLFQSIRKAGIQNGKTPSFAAEIQAMNRRMQGTFITNGGKP